MSKPKCSFCGKDQHSVRKLVAGANVFICDECVEVCVDIISEDGGWSDSEEAEPISSAGSMVVVTCTLCRMPVPTEDALPVHNRGPLCRGCVLAIEASIAAEREKDEGGSSGSEV